MKSTKPIRIRCTSRRVVLNRPAVQTRATAEMHRHPEHEEYDLVVLDIALPDGSGTELIPLLCGRYGHPTPVILFTVTEAPDEVARQVNAVLIKSRLPEDVLVGAILKLIKGRKAEP